MTRRASRTHKMPLADLWASTVNFAAPDVCWEWTGLISHNGYGRLVFQNHEYGAHRVAWEIANKATIPRGMVACHHCDNKSCVNPKHIFLGTRAENQRDMMEKNRSASGDRHGRRKLNSRQVAEIRADTRFQRIIAAEYGVSLDQIKNIKTGRQWVSGFVRAVKI